MMLNGFPIFHEYNVPLLVIGCLVIMYLVKSKQTELLFLIAPILYIFHKRLSELYIQEVIPKKNTKISSEGTRQHTHFSLSPELSNIVSKLRSYRIYSPSNYRKGKLYLKMFNTTLKDISRKETDITKQLFQNAEEYLRLSLNYFQAISFSVPEPNYIHTLRYKASESTNARKRIGRLCHQLHEICHHISYNYSHPYDLKFRESPNIYSGEIAYSTDTVYESNRSSGNELY